MPTSVRKYREAALIVFLLVFCSFVSSAQTQIDLSSQSRNVDFSGARSVIPFPTGTALPATCNPGSIFFKTDAKSGANIYGCSSQDVWTIQGAANTNTLPAWGSITGVLTNQTDLNNALTGKADTVLGNISNPSTARTNLGLGSAATQPAGAFAPTVHQHAATDITTGVIPAARLGSGTTDSTTVLYGDNVFRPLPTSPGSSTTTSAAPAAALASGVVNVTCGTPCLVNGFSFANFTGQISGFPANTTYAAYVYADTGAMKYGFPSGAAPASCVSITCLSGVNAMPAGPNIFPIAVVTLNNGTVSSVADVRNAGVSQPDIIVAGAGLSTLRSGATVTISNSVINGVSLFTGTSATLTAANLYQLVRCNNAAGCSLTVPQAGGSSGFLNGTYFWVKNDSSAGTVTITPVTSTIDNAASYSLSPGQSVQVWSDSTNYLVTPGKSIGSGGGGGATVGGSNGQIQYNNAGSLAGLTPDAANGVPLLDSTGKLKTSEFPSSYPGNAATATALSTNPTTCPAGQSPTGILANGNATGCAPNANLPASTPNMVLATDASGSANNVPALRSLVAADLPAVPVSKTQVFDPTDFSVYSVNEEFDGNSTWSLWASGGGYCTGLGQGNKGDTGTYAVSIGTTYTPWGGACNLYRGAPNANSTYGTTPLFGGNTNFTSMSWAFRFKTGATSAGNPVTVVGFGDGATYSLIQNGYGQAKPAGGLTYAAVLRVNTGSTTTTCAAQTDAAGNTVTAGTAIPANRWHIVLSNDGYGSSYCIDTGINAAPSTYYRFRIDVPQPGTVKFYLAGATGAWTQVGQTYTAANASSDPFLPMGGTGNGWLPLIATQITTDGAPANFVIDAFKGYIAGLNR